MRVEYRPISTEIIQAKSRKQMVYCALCSHPRQQWVSSPHLSTRHHLQIIILAVFLGWSLFSIIGEVAYFLYPFCWMIVDFSRKIIFRKDMICPECGFDAVHYVRDVRKARGLVKKHLDENPQSLVFRKKTLR